MSEVNITDAKFKISLNSIYSELGLSESNKVKWIRRNLIGTEKTPTIYRNGIDYIQTSYKSSNGRVYPDHLLTQETGMDLAMKLNTDFGRSYRNKIISEEQLKNKKLLSEVYRLRSELNSIYDKSIGDLNRSDSMALEMPSVGITLSKLYQYSSYKIGRNKLYTILRRNGLLTAKNNPTSLSIKRGYFKKIENKIYVSQKGYDYCTKLINNKDKIMVKVPTKREVLAILRDNSKDIHFDEPTHTYTINDKTYSSVSEYSKKYIPDFPRHTIAANVASIRSESLGEEVSKSDILKEWDLKRDIASNFGSYVHYELEKYANEAYLNHKPIKELTIDMNIFKEIAPEAEEMINRGKEYLEAKINDGYTLLDTEVMMYSPRLGYAGTIDLLFGKNGKLFIGDWKSNRKEIHNNHYDNYLKPPLDTMKSSTLNKYVVSMNLYKKLLIDITPFEVGGSEIIHLGLENYHVYSVPDLYEILK